MDVLLRFAKFREPMAVTLLNLMARTDAAQVIEDPSLPNLYDSGSVYGREKVELWTDYVTLLKAGWQDCDALAPAQAGLLMARGWRALGLGDPGLEHALRLRPKHIEAEVLMTTRVRPGAAGPYHCIIRYRIGDTWYRDDPSARLGMIGGMVDRNVLTRWRAAGVTARAPLET
jgi:hypothetical protein